MFVNAASKALCHLITFPVFPDNAMLLDGIVPAHKVSTPDEVPPTLNEFTVTVPDELFAEEQEPFASTAL